MAVQARSFAVARASASRRVNRIPITAAFWDIALPLVTVRLVGDHFPATTGNVQRA